MAMFDQDRFDLEKVDSLKSYADSIGPLSAMSNYEIDTLPTGILAMDRCLGLGGFVRGRIVDIYGPEASGKTLLSIMAIVETQRRGGLCAFLDAEGAASSRFFSNVGVNVEELLVVRSDSKPLYGEDYFDILQALIDTGKFALIVVDSVPAMVPKAIVETPMADGPGKRAHLAQLMSQGLKRITPGITNSGTVVMFINQTRKNPNQMFGDPTYSTGGTALRFYCSYQLKVVRHTLIGSDDGDDINTGCETEYQITKNKLAPTVGARFKVKVDFRSGVDKYYDAFEAGIRAGIIKQKSSYFNLLDDNNKKLMGANGRDAFLEELHKNDEYYQIIRNRVYTMIGKDRGDINIIEDSGIESVSEDKG